MTLPARYRDRLFVTGTIDAALVCTLHRKFKIWKSQQAPPSPQTNPPQQYGYLYLQRNKYTTHSNRVFSMDNFIKKLPGSHGLKVFVASALSIGLLAVPVFRQSKAHAGHDYLSSERPEAIRAGQEQARRELREKRKAEKEQQKQVEQQD